MIWPGRTGRVTDKGRGYVTPRGTTPELSADVASGWHRLCTHEQQELIAKELAREQEVILGVKEITFLEGVQKLIVERGAGQGSGFALAGRRIDDGNGVPGVSASPVSRAVILWCVASAGSSPRINLAVTPRSPPVVVACPPWAALPLAFRYRVRFLIVSILILVGDGRCSTGLSVLSLCMYSTPVLRHSLSSSPV